MKVLVQANLLAVGLHDKAEVLRQLPLCLYSTESTAEAISLLRNQKFDTVCSKWHLEAMPNGLFLAKLKMVKPNLPTIAIIDGNNPADEIEARSMGVTAVITEQCSDEILLATVSQILGIEMTEVITEKINAGT